MFCPLIPVKAVCYPGHHLCKMLARMRRMNDAVEVARDRPEAVVGGDAAVVEVLDLLQHRVGRARDEDVARQQQHRQAVDVGERRRGDAGWWRPGRSRWCTAIIRRRNSPSRRRSPRAPSPARCARGRSAARRAADTAPRPGPRRCRGRRSPTRRRRAARAGRRPSTRSAAR